MGQLHPAGPRGIRGQQRLVGQQMNGAYASGRRPHQRVERIGGEQAAPLAASGDQPVVHVGLRFGGRERHQVEPLNHAVAHLAKTRQGEQIVQLFLTEQHDLQQLALRGFQVGQEFDFLQRIGGHGLRLIDQQHHTSAAGVALHQRVLNAQQHRTPGGQGQPPIGHDGMQDFLGTKSGVGEVHQIHAAARQLLGQLAAEHGFAAAHLAHHHDDAVLVQHGMVQRLKNGAPGAAVEEKLAVGRDAERRFSEAEMIDVQRRHGNRGG